MRVQSLLLAALGVLLVSGAEARISAQETKPASAETAPEVLEAEDLGISLARIQQRLDRIPEGQEARRLLRLNYYVRVYAKAPRQNFLNDFDVHNSPIPYGVPMHGEMLRMMSPTPLSAPAANLTSVLGWSWRAVRP
jgi:hypothetical protein